MTVAQGVSNILRLAAHGHRVGDEEWGKGGDEMGERRNEHVFLVEENC